MKLKTKDSIILTIIWTIKSKLPGSLTKGKSSYTSKKLPVKSYCKNFHKIAFIKQYFTWS